MNGISSQNNNGVSFTAHMDIRGFRTDAEKMKQVAKIFAQKTQKHDEDVFIVTNTKHRVHVYHYDKSGTGLENEFEISKRKWKSFISNPTEKVANKFVKLFNISARQNKAEAKASKFMDSVLKKDKFDDPTNFESTFWFAYLKKMKFDKETEIQNDMLLKDFQTI